MYLIKEKLSMTRNKVKNQLGMTILEFAKINHFNYQTVNYAIARWTGKRGCPRGAKTKMILAELEKITGEIYYRD